MENSIKTYYKGDFKTAFWYVGIAIMNFVMGITAIAKWGDVGVGILIICGGFGIYQVIVGFWKLLFDQNSDTRKAYKFDKNPEWFVDQETKIMKEQIASEKNYKTYKMISFLVGVFCLLMGAFGSWSELALGFGAGLALQSGIMLIFGLLEDYRASYYLSRLEKYKNKG